MAASAADIQRGMAERNFGVPADLRIEFRIGINVGDIIFDGDDIIGGWRQRGGAAGSAGQLSASGPSRTSAVPALDLHKGAFTTSVSGSNFGC